MCFLDIQFHRHNRLDIILVKNHALALIFLPAADIPRFVAEGNVHLGITGQDQVAEFYLSAEEGHGEIHEVLKLGFGNCSLRVQVPENGDIDNAEELIGKRIVTSFTGLTKQYFGKLEEGKIKEGHTTIKYVGGSVEAACALGVADGIIDIVGITFQRRQPSFTIESGETMKAAGLKAIDTVMESQAVLISSTASGSLSPKLSHEENGSLQTLITNRIRGLIAAKRYVLLEYNVPRSMLSEVIKITPGKRAPTVSTLETPGEQWVAVSVMVEREKAAGVMDQLENHGASDILVFDISNSRQTSGQGIC